MQLKFKYLILVLITLTNPWFFKILNVNILATVLLVVITFLLFIQISWDKNRPLIQMAIILFSVYTFIITNSNFDKLLFVRTTEEVYGLNERRNYYPKYIGLIFQNKINITLNKYLANLSENLDPNIYFFAGHPRERGNISDFEKFSPILIPFFLIGLFWSIRIRNGFVFGYNLSIIFFSGFLSPNNNIGSLMFFPLMCVLICQGIIITINMLHNHRR